MSAVLFIVATPIGNLSDMTLRALETLKTVDVIASEDTRRTQQLLNHFSLRKPTLRYDEHSHDRASRDILDRLAAGASVALVTDAGTPAISDPGARLVQAVIAAGFQVVPIPGPSSVTAALSASGFPSDGFVFMGFISRRPGRAARALREARRLGKTLVLLESPFRVIATLRLIEQDDPDASVVVARELTKIYEEFIRGSARAVRTQLEGRTPKGEFVIMIGPSISTADRSESIE